MKADYGAATSDFDKALALKLDFDEAKAGRELAQAAMTEKRPQPAPAGKSI